MIKKALGICTVILTAVLCVFSISFAQENEKKVPIYFSADEVEENSKTGVIVASGDVNINRNGVTLKADKLTYDRQNDILTAEGNVSIMHTDGTVVFSEYARLSDKMSKATITEVKAILADKSRIAAQRIKQTANKDKHFFYAVYSPCDVCENNPKPLWSLKARKITHDASNKDVYYRSAFLSFKDVPVLYTPFMSHPDPSVKRRSGFLTPSMASNNYLGTALELRYFINISDHEDLLLTPVFSSDQDIILGGRYRKMLYSGELDMSGTIMKDKDTDEIRGNIVAKGRYEINDLWVANMDINYASDGAYLKDLSLPGKTETWLTSKISAERFDNRNYASIEGYSYKLVSHSLRTSDIDTYKQREYSKPYILPLATYEYITESNSIGAYFKNTFNIASIYREHDETQTQRATMINSWNLPYTSPFGEKYRLTASLKSDFYYVDDYFNNKNENYTGVVGRIFPQLGMEWRLPFVKATESSRQIVEPIIVAVAAPNGGNDVDKIPNEDSLNAQFDDSNILDLDRYAGYDRNDTGSRISYGFNWSAYGNVLGRTSSFFGQTYYVKKNESFAQTMGNDSHFSDYVGRIFAAPNSYIDFNYRFRLDKNNFSMKYTEINTRIGTSMISAYISFISIKGRDQDSADSSLYFFDDYKERKELYTSLRAKLSKDWSLELYNRQDLSDRDVSLEHGGKLIYEDECFKLIFNTHKYNSTDPDYDDGYEFSATFLLKTLGGIGSE